MMKILVLSDIHANKFALDAVISDANRYYPGYDAVWFLGDLIGYGANPVETYSTVIKLCNHNGQYHVWISGNHEETLKIEEERLNITNSEQVDRRHLGELFSSSKEVETHFTNITKAENKRKEMRIKGYDWSFYLTHTSFLEPDEDEKYLYPWFDEDEHYKNLFKEEYYALPGHSLESRCLLYGHTHVPTLVQIQQKEMGGLELSAKKIMPFVTYRLEKGCTWFINPGSVGIPNDKDTRASYAIIELDSATAVPSFSGFDTITFCRVAYNLVDAISAMAEKGYDFSPIIQKYQARLVDAIPDDKTPQAWLDHYDQAKEKKREN